MEVFFYCRNRKIIAYIISKNIFYWLCKENKRNTKWIFLKKEWIKFCVWRNVLISHMWIWIIKEMKVFPKGFIYLRSLISCWINIMKYIYVQTSQLRKFSTVLYFVVLHLMWQHHLKMFFPRGHESSLKVSY